jgi:hypothetical protein
METIRPDIDFTFDAETHTYRVGGAIVPGVTGVLRPLYSWDMVNQEMLQIAAERGSAVHLATELDDRNDLDEESVFPEIRTYLDAWRKFRTETGFVPTSIEERLYHDKYGYACTLDRIGVYRRREIVLEIKTVSQLHPATGVQLAAQREAWMHNRKPRSTPERFAVQLRKNGTYRFEPYEDPADWPTFLALLTTMNFRKKHKLN